MNSTFKSVYRTLAIFIMAILLSCTRQDPHSLFLDKFPDKGEKTRLVIFWPSAWSVEALQKLDERGLFPLDEIEVIGVFHEKEKTDYEEAARLALDRKLDWIRFYPIKGELNKDNLYRKNPCSDQFERIFRQSDGMIFFGGWDIPPYTYQEKTSLLTQINTTYRHFVELSALFHLLGGYQDPDYQPLLTRKPDYPILGICLGSQTMNVATGGTMIQDIWFYQYGKTTYDDVLTLDRNQWHNNPWARLYPEKKLIRYNMHAIRLSDSGKFGRDFGFSPADHPYVVSSHHQMYDKPGKNILFIATSMDGKVPEGLEHKLFPNVLGIQFHIEFPVLWDDTARVRFTPTDTEGINLLQFLKDHSPSLEFNQKIWQWFRESLIVGTNNHSQ